MQAVELQAFVRRVDHRALFGVEALFAHVSTLDEGHYGQIEVLGKGVVTAVVCRHGHNGTSAISGQHIVAYVYWNLLAGDGVDGIRAAEHTAHLLVDESLALGLVLHLAYVGFHSRLLVGSGHLVHIFTFGSKHHECYTENSVGACGENEQIEVAVLHLEVHLSSLAIANPVALRLLDGVRPVHSVEVTQQAACIGANAQTPLAHHFLHHRIAAAHTHALAHLIVGKHSAQLGTPVYHGVATVGNAEVHEHIVFLHLAHGVPLLCGEAHLGCGVGIASLCAALFKVLHKFADGASLVEGGVVVAIEHFQESPLRPLVVFWVAGAHLAVPVVAEAYLVELLAIAADVFLRCHLGVLTRLDGILLGRQTIGVIAHGVKHIEAAQTLVARKYVAGNVAQRVSHMQTRTRGVWKHVEHIVFGFVIVYFSLIGVVLLPVGLPLLLYLFIFIFHIIYIVLLSRCYKLFNQPKAL